MVCCKPMVNFIADFYFFLQIFPIYVFKLVYYDTITDRCHLLPRFPPLSYGATFSTPAFSTLATWCHVFHSRVFHPCHLVPRFPLPRFQRPHFEKQFRNQLGESFLQLHSNRSSSKLRATSHLSVHEPGNCVFSVRHRHLSSPGECGWSVIANV